MFFILFVFLIYYYYHLTTTTTTTTKQKKRGRHDKIIDTERLEQIIQTLYHDELTTTNPILEIDYNTLSMYYNTLAEKLLTDYPRTKHQIEEIINKLTIQNTKKQLKLKNITPQTPIKEIHSNKRGQLISTTGTIKRITTVYNQITHITWTCNNCGTNTKYKMNYNDKITPPKTACKGCGKNKGYTLDLNETKFKDIQKYTLQDKEETTPTTITGFVEEPFINTIAPGDEVTLNGLVELRNQKKENVFKEYIKTENITFTNKDNTDTITPQEARKFKEYTQTHDIFQELTKQIAPALQGYNEIKEAILLQIFGAQSTTNPDRTTIRGDIHILLIGDPGIGKSQILKSITQITPRSIYTSGKSSSGAGLTASAVKDENESWTFEAGAMVLADKGLVCIDEFDKMRTDDRSSIHEAMEQQTVSMAKAGNITTLKSRCSVLAASNPKYGNFNPYKSIQEQVKLSSTLLSRFDLIFLITDKYNMENDKHIAESIFNNTSFTDDSREIDFKRYITYAKQQKNPPFTEKAKKKLVRFYTQWRQSSKENDDSMIVTVRQLMALQRLSIASARARLSEVVNLEDVERAIRLEEYCIRQNGYTIDEKTSPIKIEDKLEHLKEKIIPNLATDYNNHIPFNVILMKAKEANISQNDTKQWLRQCDEDGWLVFDSELQQWSMQ